MYGMATTDHIPVSLMLNVESLPELSSYDNHEPIGKLNWARMTEKDLWHYKSLTDKGLSYVDIPYDAFQCDNINCKNQNHSKDLCIICEKIVNCLIRSGKLFCNNSCKQHNVRPGWNEYVSELHAEAKEAFKTWVLSGKARHGPECERKKQANARFKYAVRFN